MDLHANRVGGQLLLEARNFQILKCSYLVIQKANQSIHFFNFIQNPDKTIQENIKKAQGLIDNAKAEMQKIESPPAIRGLAEMKNQYEFSY